jgi:hypothetical protein
VNTGRGEIKENRSYMSGTSENLLIKKGMIAVAVIMVILCIAPASALTLTGTKYMDSIPAGGTDTHKMTIGIGPTDNPGDFTVTVMGFGQDMNKGYVPLDPSKDLNPSSARSFISLDKTTLHLDPGTTQEVTATISLPKNVGAGGRYGIIYLYAVPGKGQMVTTAVVIPVMITISGTTPTFTGSITGVEVGKMIAGQPLSVITTLKNTGNYHYYRTVNLLTIIDAKGNILANSSTSPSAEAITPGNTVQFTGKLDVKSLPVGSYKVNSKVLLEDGQVLDEKSTPYEVETEYVPPPDEASITVSPGSPTTLVTPDGRYSVSFPQGAVFSNVNVTLKAYAHDQLQSAPSGAKLGTSSFEITGLSGLLSKDATVKVKYSADDLAAAGGDASQLKLAYYDTAQNAWVILPTMVETGSKTLTATTNHLSVWAVMISSSTTGTPVAVSAPLTTTAQGSPLPLTIIVISLAIAALVAGYHPGKRD